MSYSIGFEMYRDDPQIVRTPIRLVSFAARALVPALLLALFAAQSANAQEVSPEPESAPALEEKPRPTGLPKNVNWIFNFDVGVGTFGFNNSLYVAAPGKADSSGDLSDDWIESYAKAGLAADMPLGGGALFGKASAVGERTFSAPPTLVGEDASSFHAEDAYLGWRSNEKGGEDGFELLGGRAPYELGHGMLVWDGAGDGGSRGGFWSGARKSWEVAGIGRFRMKRNLLEGFYLDRDELPENDTGSELWGVNYELTLGEATTIGVTYLETTAITASLRDGMTVVDGRIFSQPFQGAMSGLSVELEYAQEDNAELLKAIGWSAQAGFTFASLPWSPALSYRYAFFQGDDPTTPESEAFDPLFPGFHDWGTWWQGEIAGEYFLSNSNLISHQVRLNVAPNDALGIGFIGYAFYLDQLETFAGGVVSDELAFEINGYVDWKINSNFTTSLVLAYTEPMDAIEQGYGRTEPMSYGMLYLSYAY